MFITYDEVVNNKLIHDGDILLFRGQGLISYLIHTYSHGVHSHAAIAYWDDDLMMTVEMLAFIGGRVITLKNQLDQKTQIDVYRCSPEVNYYCTTKIGNDFEAVIKTYFFNDLIKAKIIRDMLILTTGRPYAWRTIWLIVKHYIPFIRLKQSIIKDDDLQDVRICSAATASVYRKNFLDLVPQLPDHMVTPADLARSTLLSYQFSMIE